MNEKDDPGSAQVFRSPAAVALWWVWLLFAVGNLIDLAIQGRDHLSLVAAFVLVFATGICYVAALRPRVTADDEGVTITNPVRHHRVGWAAVAGADSTDLLRVRCEWPAAGGTARRAIYSWAVHSSRRRQVVAEMRARRGERRGGFGVALPSQNPDPLRVDTARLIDTLTERAEQARLAEPGADAAAPVSTWDWRAVAAVAIPGLALLAVVLALPCHHYLAVTAAGWTAWRAAIPRSRLARPP